MEEERVKDQTTHRSTDESTEVDGEEVASEDISFEQTEHTDARDAQIEDLTQQLLRVRADFDNFRRRTRQEQDDLSRFATKKLLADLLPVVDNFDRAMLSDSPTDEDSQWKTGILMVQRQLSQVLGNYGVAAMEVEGEPFDPTRHEAVMQEQVDGQPSGIVLQELQKGYMLHDKVLRPAMVKVSL